MENVVPDPDVLMGSVLMVPMGIGAAPEGPG